eukprot:2459854-Heterocapsa_arctica.AAC.1
MMRSRHPEGNPCAKSLRIEPWFLRRSQTSAASLVKGGPGCLPCLPTGIELFSFHQLVTLAESVG